MLFSQLARADSLREICNGMACCLGRPVHLGVDGSPSRSALSYANVHRPAKLFEDLFWTTAERFRRAGMLGQHKPFRFKNKLLSLDSATISLCLRLFPWASFRRAKGGVKLHVRKRPANHVSGGKRPGNYCWPVGFTKRHLTKMEGRHVAYVGSLEADPRLSVAVVYDLGRLLAQTGINFHIYPSYTSHVRTLRQEIGQVVPSDLMKYVHIHDTVRFQDLTRELSAFHAGILVSNKSVNYGEKGDTYYPIMGEYFLASKLFDYHEAGLPCVTQQMRIARHMFPRDGAFREVRTLQEVADVVSQMGVCQIEVHPKRRLDHHAHRMAEFYLRLYRQRAASTRR
jgi:hypothetical protein